MVASQISFLLTKKHIQNTRVILVFCFTKSTYYSMKKSIQKIVLASLSLILFVTSCAEQNDNVSIEEQNTGTVEFSIQESVIKNSSSKQSKGTAAKTNSLEDVTKAIITILAVDGSSTDYDNTELNVNRLNGELLVQKIALPIGDYQLTQFSFMDVNNDIIYTTPLAGSDLADLVTNPLAINFAVANGSATPVDIEVVSTETYTPQDFGLVSFPITEVEKLDFLLAVSELGSNEILAGEYSVTATGFSTTKAFTAIEENVVTVRDITDAVYELHVSVEGYESQTIELTRHQIATIYHVAPLVVELTKVTNLLSNVIEQNINAPLCLGGAGQSFTASENFIWKVLEVQSCSGAQTGSLTIYDGSGTGNPILLTQNITLIDGINQIILDTPISCTAGHQYTFSTNLALSYSFGGDPYPGGVSYSGGAPFVADRDMYFKIGN